MGMRGQISLDLILTLLVLGAFLQVLLGMAGDWQQAQAGASLNRQAQRLAGEAESALEIRELEPAALRVEWTLPGLKEPGNAKPVECEVEVVQGRLRVNADGKTLTERALAGNLREGKWLCGDGKTMEAG